MEHADRQRLLEDLVRELEEEKEHQVRHLHNIMRWYYLMESRDWFPLGPLAQLKLWTEQNLILLRMQIDELSRMLDDAS